MKFKGIPKKLKSQISNLKSKTKSLKISVNSNKENKDISKNPQLKVKKKEETKVEHQNIVKKAENKEEHNKKYSPNINRIITERIKKFFTIRWALSATIICASAFLVIIFLIFLQLQQIRALKVQRNVLQVNLRAWQAILRKYPDYRDGYLQAAVLEYRLSNLEAARQDVEKALFLDPTYEPAKSFLNILNRR